ncbi:MAG TPA: protein kinase, partial [Polyangium sp.]|nr:protein kinase [Polyangium sp.]
MALWEDPTQPEPERAPVVKRAARRPLNPGTHVAHYELMRPLGQGGMGDVWLARDTRLGRRVALKFLLQVNPKHATRFFIEAQATAQLAHENIVALYDIGEHENCPYMVLEYVPGKTLSTWLAERRTDAHVNGVPAARVASLMLPVARALKCAHDAGIIHRDLKPANIMLAESGKVKVLDFGVAKLTSSTADSLEDKGEVSRPDWASNTIGSGALTEAGVMVGTRSYMAPEQWWGEAIDGRTDLWALGIMMYQMVAGEHPCAPISPESLLEVAKREIPMPSIRERVPEAGRLGIIVDRCLMKYRDDRLESAEELCNQLEEIARERFGGRGEQGEDEVNPYTGLSAFQERDAAFFFGREALVEHIVLRLIDQPLLALVGSSGAGKSSLARAGVIPALVRGGDAWEAFVVRPGPHPLAMLADLLLQHSWQRSSMSGDSPTSGRNHLHGEIHQREAMLEQLQNEPGFLGVQLRSRAARRRERIFLFIDQFEEAFTLASEVERSLFFQCLIGAADDTSSPLRVMISIRHDFLDRVASASGVLAEWISRGTVLVGPLDPPGLRRALVAPAEAFSYRLESEALICEMLDVLTRTSSALPLLQFTAARLWEGRNREKKVLTEATYREFGGVEGALASHANSVVGAMSGTEKKWAKTLLSRLVTPEYTRAIVTRRELAEIGGNAAPEVERVLGRLVDARLIVVEGAGAESTVELVHESLIVKWPQFRQWLEEDKDEAKFLMRLRSAAKEWEQSGRPEGLLWRGDAANEGRHQWQLHHAGQTSTALSAREEQFLAAVVALGDRERRWRRGAVVTAMAILSVVVVVVSMLALKARDEAARANQEAIHTKNANVTAEMNAARARNATRMAVAREHQDDATLVLAVLREVETESIPRGWNDLMVMARNSSTATAVLLHEDAVRDAAFHPDGQSIVSACLDGTVRVWSIDGLGEPRILRGHEGAAWSAVFSPDGKRIVSASQDRTIRIWNTDGSEKPIVLEGHDGTVNEAAFSPDGKRIISASSDKTVRIWNTDGTGEPIILRGHEASVYTAAFLHDGKRVISGGFDNTLRVWNADGSGTPKILRGHEAFVYAVAAHPDGKRFASASGDQTIRVWNVDDSQPPLVLRGHEGEVYGVAFSKDGKRIVSASQDRTLRVWSSDGTGAPSVIRGHRGNANRVAFSPDGKKLVSASYDQSVRIWDVDDSSRRQVISSMGGSAYGAEYSPDGQWIAGALSSGDILVWNTKSMEQSSVIHAHAGAATALVWSP